MKRIICLLLVCVLAISFAGCNNADKKDANGEVVLTRENIKDYLCIEGEFKGDENNQGDYYYDSVSELYVQMYSVAPGGFKNVEISIIVKSEDDDFNRSLFYDDHWHLEDMPDEDKIILNIKLGTDGNLTKRYTVCRRDWGCNELTGEAILKIASISGSFVPSK